MTEVTWGQLAKAVADPTKIPEEIDAKILTHNNDPSGHGQASESVYNHRIAAILDHLDESIKNVKIAVAHRTYKAIVDPGGDADFIEIQDAIDYVHGEGGGTILIKAGTYTLDADLTLYSDIELLGEDDDLSIIDFNGTDKQVKIIGTALNPLVNIKLLNLQFTGRRANTGSAINSNYVEYLDIEGCKFTDNYKSAGTYGKDIYLEDADHVKNTRNRFLSSGQGIETHFCNDVAITNNYFYDCQLDAIYNPSEFTCIIQGNYFLSNLKSAIYANAEITGLVINGNFISGSDDYGIYIGAALTALISDNHIDSSGIDGIHLIFTEDGLTVLGNVCVYNTRDGIRLNGSDEGVICSNNCKWNGGRGIYLMTGADKNSCIGNVCLSNTTAQITNSGTGNEVAHNIIA